MTDDDASAKDDRQTALEKSAAAARDAARRAPPIEVASAAISPVSPPEPAVKSAPIIECRGVVQRYPNARGGYQIVLDGIDFTVPEHDFLSVVGPSGCGKSTLLRLVLGSESPYKGFVRTRGEDVGHPDRRRGIVFQRYSLFPHLTVLENVMFGLELDGTWLLQKWLTWPFYRRTHQKRFVEMAMDYLRTVNLDEHAYKYPHQLSGGMQQRVAIAQAMVMKPDILLMDEPFGALDPGTRESLQHVIIETFEKQRTTVFFVTHDLEEALFVGRRLLVLSPFYEREPGAKVEGSRLVVDQPTPRGDPAVLKQSGEFRDLIASIRRQGFDPALRKERV